MDAPSELDQEQTTAASGVVLSRDGALPIGRERDLVVLPNVADFVELSSVSVEPYEPAWGLDGAA